MPILADLPQTWTFDDLRRLLPEDTDNDVDWRRFEIIDGALVVSPSADLDHEYVIDQLRIALRPQLPGQLWVVGPAMVDLHPSYRIPDLLVLPRYLLGRHRQLVLAADVTLAVEVVSPSSRLADRIAKPAQYAAAGIPGYWRVETEPEVTLTAYALDSTAYTELGTWGRGQTATIERPFPARITIDDLIP